MTKGGTNLTDAAGGLYFWYATGYPPHTRATRFFQKPP